MAELVDARAFGALEAEVEGLKRDISELRSEVRELTSLVQQVKGGWKFLAGAVGVSTAMAGLALAAWKSLVSR
jgi:predicted  nucleic acid-binding Zn-ribbon protein